MRKQIPIIAVLSFCLVIPYAHAQDTSITTEKNSSVSSNVDADSEKENNNNDTKKENFEPDIENSEDSFNYVDLYDPSSKNFVSPPAYPVVNYYNIHKPDPLQVKDVGISPPVYPIPNIDQNKG